MNKIYRTIFGYGEDNVIINKSKFIGYAMPINSEEEALEFIELIKIKHRDATHNVYAYVFGKDSNTQRFSDDGEPTGTAGIPVLEVIKKENLRNIVVVVTRYFGGTKLGAGGLIRAYTRAAKISLDSGNIVDMVLHAKIKIRIDYTLYGKVENYLINENYIVDGSVFDDAVNVFVYIEESKIEDFIKITTDLTSGNAIFESIDEEYISIKDGKRII